MKFSFFLFIILKLINVFIIQLNWYKVPCLILNAWKFDFILTYCQIGCVCFKSRYCHILLCYHVLFGFLIVCVSSTCCLSVDVTAHLKAVIFAYACTTQDHCYHTNSMCRRECTAEVGVWRWGSGSRSGYAKSAGEPLSMAIQTTHHCRPVLQRVPSAGGISRWQEERPSCPQTFQSRGTVSVCVSLSMVW